MIWICLELNFFLIDGSLNWWFDKGKTLKHIFNKTLIKIQSKKYSKMLKNNKNYWKRSDESSIIQITTLKQNFFNKFSIFTVIYALIFLQILINKLLIIDICWNLLYLLLNKYALLEEKEKTKLWWR